MGVRMALGTTPAGLRAGLIRQGLITIGTGAVAGVAGVVLSGRLLESLVEGAKPATATTYAATVLLVVLVGAAGIWFATRPLTRLEVVEVLRAE